MSFETLLLKAVEGRSLEEMKYDCGKSLPKVRWYREKYETMSELPLASAG